MHDLFNPLSGKTLYESPYMSYQSQMLQKQQEKLHQSEREREKDRGRERLYYI